MSAVSEVTGTVEAAVARPFGEVKKGYTSFSDGDILFAKVSPCMQNGKHAIARDLVNRVGFGSTEFHVIRPGPRVLAEWVHYFLRRQDTLQAATMTFNGAVGLQRVPPDFLESLRLPVPPLEIQRDQVNLLRQQLAAVEEARRAAQAQTDEMGALRAAIYREISQAIPEDSSSKILGDVLLGIEAGKSLQTSEVLARENELGILKVSAVSWSAFRPEEAKAILNHEPDERHRVKAGDLLLSRANTRELVGAVVLVEKDYPQRILSDKTLRLVVDPTKADKLFLMYALRTPAARAHIEELASGSSDSMRNISQGVITSIPIPLPELQEQQRIAQALRERLAAVKEMKRAVQAQLDEIRQLPARLLAQAFASQADADDLVAH
jgi:type I restriction enzyme S subunit